MKKLLVFIFMVSSLMLLTISAGAELVGDVDFNGKVSAADARLVLRQAVKIQSFDEYQAKVGDVDFSGKITASDARLVLRVSIGADTFSKTEVDFEREKNPVNNFELYDKTVTVTAIAGDKTVSGRGAYVCESGMVVTNYHIIKDAYNITVSERNSKPVYVDWIYRIDAKNDIAVLHVSNNKTPNKHCPVMPKVGEKVYFYNGEGYSKTADFSAVVTGYDYDESLNSNTKYLKVSKAIKPENSGAPVFDEGGNVVGITMWNSAVPADTTYIIPIGFVYSVNNSNIMTMKNFAAQNGAPYANTLTAENSSAVITPFGYSAVKLTVDKKTAPENYEITVDYGNNKLFYVWSPRFDLDSDGWSETVFIVFTARERFENTLVNLYISGNKEMYEEIFVSCRQSDNKLYPGSYGVPDIGICLNVMPTGIDYNTYYSRIYYDFTNAPMTNTQIAAYNQYFENLKQYGFKYEGQTEQGAAVYTNSATGKRLSVYVERVSGSNKIKSLLITIE